MIDDLINEARTTSQYGYDKKTFIKKKQEQKKLAFEIIDKAIETLRTDTSFFQEYLNIQGKFDKYTPRNALLVAKQNSNARQLKEKIDWIKDGVTFNSKNPNITLVLEPGKKYLNNEGREVTNWYIKELIDISETNAKPNIKIYDNKIIFQAIIHICQPMEIRAVDNLENDRICEWKQDENAIYVCRKPDYDSLIKGLLAEISKVNLSEKTNTIDEDKSNCIAYMVCKKYGIDFPISNLEKITQKYSKMNSKEIIDDLTIMKDITLDMNSKIIEYLGDRKKELRNRQQER